ncbi:MAG: beta-N-acetylhexosaminidase [Rhodothermaceae bacterium]
MKKILLQIFTVLLFTTQIIASGDLNIIPEPKKWELTKEKFNLGERTIVLSSEIKNKSVTIALDEIKEILKTKFNSSFGVNGQAKLILKIEQNKKLGEEGYKLNIEADKIEILAAGEKGIFYGLQSLKQIMKNPENKTSLPGCRVVDFPDYKIRAISDDISRGPIPILDFMKKQIRKLAELKVNTIIHYVEHVVKTKKHPAFAPDDGSLTIEEWKEIADYALDYNVMIVGGFQSFGHFNKILETPEYAHLGESGSLISPVLDESYKFLEDIYDEMIPAFHSPYFNINCDETFDLGKEKSKELVDKIGYAEVYYQHIMKLYNIVKKHNKQVIMWGDILLEYPELLEKLPKDIIVGTWNYDPLDNFDKLIKPIKEAGFEFWVVPGLLNSRRVYPNYYQAPKNIQNFCRDGLKYNAAGMMNCFWDDGGASLFSLDWYGAAYGAEKGWNVFSDNKTFDERVNKTIYGITDNSFTDIMWKLSELAKLEPTDALNDKVPFEKILPDAGKDLKLSLAEWDQVLKIAKEANEILLNTKPLYNKEELEYHQFIINVYSALAQERFDLFEAATLYKEAVKIQKEDLFGARELVLKSIKLITEIISRQQKNRDQFEILWLKENHTYAVEWITNKYDEKIKEFLDVKKKLFSSLRKLDSSEKLLSAKDVRLSITKLPGKYFTQWMMINPITDLPEENLLTPDYLEDMGGEETAKPKVTQEFYYKGQKLRWRRFVSSNPDITDVKERYADVKGNSVIYLFANLSVENDTSVTASVGQDEEIEIFLNGKSVYKNSGSSDFVVDYKTFKLDLPKGKNNLLIKSSYKKGDWNISFRLPESKVRNSKNRYRIIR